jgi:hypothetical protein
MSVENVKTAVALPKLMVSSDNGLVILAYGRKEYYGAKALVGVVVKPVKSEEKEQVARSFKVDNDSHHLFVDDNIVGHFSDTWKESAFVPYDETVTIRNPRKSKKVATAPAAPTSPKE